MVATMLQANTFCTITISSSSKPCSSPFVWTIFLLCGILFKTNMNSEQRQKTEKTQIIPPGIIKQKSDQAKLARKQLISMFSFLNKDEVKNASEIVDNRSRARKLRSIRGSITTNQASMVFSGADRAKDGYRREKILNEKHTVPTAEFGAGVFDGVISSPEALQALVTRVIPEFLRELQYNTAIKSSEQNGEWNASFEGGERADSSQNSDQTQIILMKLVFHVDALKNKIKEVLGIDIKHFGQNYIEANNPNGYLEDETLDFLTAIYEIANFNEENTAFAQNWGISLYPSNHNTFEKNK